MKSINLSLSSVEVKAEVRQLRSKLTREMATDLQHYHDIDLSSFEKYFLKELRKENRKKSINKIFNN